MATRYLSRSLFATKQSFASAFSCSYTSASSSVIPNSSSFLFRIRPLVAASAASYFRRLPPNLSTRGFATRQTASSLNDPNPNWSNRPPKETILLDGCDFEHWLVVMEKPEGDPTRDEIIDSYIKTLAMVVGSEEEARMKIYSVSTRHYFAFGALVSEELSYKIKELPRVRWVLPDSYLDVKNKDYGGEPFINGQAVPYDPKYHEEWVRNNARANERNRRNDRPRNFDRSRNFERRREFSNQNAGGPAGNMGGQPNMMSAPNTGGMQPNMHQQQPNMGGQPNMHQQQPNMGGQPNMHQQQPNMGGHPNMHQQQPNMGGQPNMHQQQPMGGQPNYGAGVPPNNPGHYPPNNMGGMPNTAPNYQYGNGPNPGGMPHQSGPGPNQNFNPNMGSGFAPSQPGFTPRMGPGQVQSQNSFTPNAGYGNAQNQGGYAPRGPGPNQGNYAANTGPGPVPNQSGYATNTGDGNPYQNQNVPGRDPSTQQNY